MMLFQVSSFYIQDSSYIPLLQNVFVKFYFPLPLNTLEKSCEAPTDGGELSLFPSIKTGYKL